MPHENPLNILVLHRLGDPDAVAFFLQRHVFALRNNFPENNYLYHDISLPLPAYVAETQFDAIILDVTLLCMRWAPRTDFEKLKADYGFVKHANAVKIAFPQDEYDHHIILDDWMCDWNIDVVFSVISSHWDVLYPRYSQKGEIKLGFTGYIDETLIEVEPKPFDQRSIDIGYRAAELPPYFGRMGHTKWTIGRDVARLSEEFGLKSDIVLGYHGKLFGTAWFDFIEDSKFTLGSNSGSSILDADGELQKRVKQYCAAHPDASFDEVEENCFKGEDGKQVFSAISPRIMEAALLNSCQILVEGEYSGIIKPDEHYIPIKADASNFQQVYDAMQDRDLVQNLIRNCRKAILDAPQLRYKNKSVEVLEIVREGISRKQLISDVEQVRKIAAKYEHDIAVSRARLFKRQAMRKRISGLLDKSPFISKSLRSVYRKVRAR